MRLGCSAMSERLVRGGQWVISGSLGQYLLAQLGPKLGACRAWMRRYANRCDLMRLAFSSTWSCTLTISRRWILGDFGKLALERFSLISKELIAKNTEGNALGIFFFLPLKASFKRQPEMFYGPPTTFFACQDTAGWISWRTSDGSLLFSSSVRCRPHGPSSAIRRGSLGGASLPAVASGCRVRLARIVSRFQRGRIASSDGCEYGEEYQ